MPLDLAALASGLEDCFSDPPGGRAECAQAWADAVESYAASIVPASGAVSAAAATLSTALAMAFASSNAAPAMETAFAAFAVTVGGGMAGYAPTPPPAPVGFAAQFSGPKPATHADAAEQIANLIDAWMVTGTSTLSSPPGTVVTWN